jgi:hypothetical protein
MKDTGKNSIYLIDNGLREAGDDFLDYAEALGVRLTRFHSSEAFKVFWSVLSQAEPENTAILYPDYADWSRLAHAVIHLHPHRKGYQTGFSNGHLHRVTASYHIKDSPVSPERVADLLNSLLGPGLDGESLRLHNEGRFKRNFCFLLHERYADWSKKQVRSEERKSLKGETFGDEATKRELKRFFDHCPFCLGAKIRIKYWQSSRQTWRELAGRAGYRVICGACGEDLYFEMTAMS